MSSLLFATRESHRCPPSCITPDSVTILYFVEFLYTRCSSFFSSTRPSPHFRAATPRLFSNGSVFWYWEERRRWPAGTLNPGQFQNHGNGPPILNLYRVFRWELVLYERHVTHARRHAPRRNNRYFITLGSVSIPDIFFPFDFKIAKSPEILDLWCGFGDLLYFF